LISSSQKEQYECLIPSLSEYKESKNEVFYTGLSPFQLLLPLFTTSAICSYRVENYWNYQLCFGNYVRQFHEERDGKNRIDCQFKVIQVDNFCLISVKVQEYILGKWNPEHNTEAYQAKINQNNEKLNYKKIDGVNLPYFEVEMANGEIKIAKFSH
jgi:endoplasmic reticulum lectin 1